MEPDRAHGRGVSVQGRVNISRQTLNRRVRVPPSVSVGTRTVGPGKSSHPCSMSIHTESPGESSTLIQVTRWELCTHSADQQTGKQLVWVSGLIRVLQYDNTLLPSKQPRLIKK